MKRLSGHPVGWPDIQAFYRDNPAAGRSREIDYGVHWSGPQPWPRFRLTYVYETGQIILFNEATGQVALLAEWSPLPEDLEHLYQATEMVLAGWEDACLAPGSCSWIRRALAAASSALCEMGEGHPRLRLWNSALPMERRRP